MKIYFTRQIFEKSPNTKIHKHPSIGSRFATYGRIDGLTDLTKLIAAFRNFAKAPENCNIEETVDDNMNWVELKYKEGRVLYKRG